MVIKEHPLKNSDSYTTIYAKNYLGLPAPIPDKIVYDKGEDHLSTPHLEVLLPDKYKYTKKVLDHESIPDFCTRILKEKPVLQRYIDKEPDEEVISKVVEESGKSVYQVDYCKGAPLMSKKGMEVKRITLPDGWKIPQTVAQKSYRTFRDLFDYDILKEKPSQHRGNLMPNEKAREIRRVKTGESEYQDKISALGGQINDEELHGKIKRYSCEILEDR